MRSPVAVGALLLLGFPIVLAEGRKEEPPIITEPESAIAWPDSSKVAQLVRQLDDPRFF